MNWLQEYFPQKKTVCVAEIGLNHGGDLRRAMQMITAASEAGADAVKFQSLRGEELYSVYSASYSAGEEKLKEDRSVIDIFNGCMLSEDEYRKLKMHAASCGLYMFASVFSLSDVDFFDSIDVPFFKVASSDITYLQLFEKLAETGKPVILSTGMATDEEIERALDILEGVPVVLLHCVSLYPAPVEGLKLQRLEILKKKFKQAVGFSDHSQGMLASTAAVSLGAVMIERHFTDVHEPSVLDDCVSFDSSEFKAMVEQIRLLERALEVPKHAYSVEEKEIIKKSRRSAYASSDIPAGTVLIPEMISWKRPEFGVSADAHKSLDGAVTVTDIAKDTAITAAMIKGTSNN